MAYAMLELCDLELFNQRTVTTTAIATVLSLVFTSPMFPDPCANNIPYMQRLILIAIEIMQCLTPLFTCSSDLLCIAYRERANSYRSFGPD